MLNLPLDLLTFSLRSIKIKQNFSELSPTYKLVLILLKIHYLNFIFIFENKEKSHGAKSNKSLKLRYFGQIR